MKPPRLILTGIFNCSTACWLTEWQLIKQKHATIGSPTMLCGWRIFVTRGSYYGVVDCTMICRSLRCNLSHQLSQGGLLMTPSHAQEMCFLDVACINQVRQDLMERGIYGLGGMWVRDGAVWCWWQGIRIAYRSFGWLDPHVRLFAAWNTCQMKVFYHLVWDKHFTVCASSTC